MNLDEKTSARAGIKIKPHCPGTEIEITFRGLEVFRPERRRPKSKECNRTAPQGINAAAEQQFAEAWQRIFNQLRRMLKEKNKK